MKATSTSTRTGGIARFPATVADIESAAVAIAHEIRNQYTIGYASLDQRLDGSYRAIRVTINGRDGMTVHTRAGYRATRATS